MPQPSLLLAHVALVGALTVGCAEQPSPTAPAEEPLRVRQGPSLSRTTEHSRQRFPIEGSFTSICTGELITYSGVFTQLLNLVTDPAGNQTHGVGRFSFHIKAIGQPSGTKYVGQEEFTIIDRPPIGRTGSGTNIGHEVSTLVSQGSLPNEYFSYNVHFVTTGNGETKITVNNVVSECR